MARRTTGSTTDAEPREPINLFGDSSSRDGSGTGTDTGDHSGNDATGVSGTEESTQSSESSTPQLEFTSPEIIIEAPQVNGRRGRRGRLSTSYDTGDKPLQTPSKRAEKYIRKLQTLWYKMHGLLGAIIDDHLRWTIEESQLFAEAAYDVFAERGWLKYLDKANEAYLLVIVVEIEITKVKAMLADQAKQPKKDAKVGPPPQLKAVQTEPRANEGNVVPSFVAAPSRNDLDGMLS